MGFDLTISLNLSINEDTGLLEAGVDPRGSKSEAFPQWACVW